MKVDETTHKVHGIATAEVVDKAGEICDYDDSKKLYKQWSDEIKGATTAAGQEPSLGNVRLQHSLEIAGKLTAMNFNDEEKCIEVVAEPVDDRIWGMIRRGFITGFSHGGNYVYRRCDKCSGDMGDDAGNFKCGKCGNVNVRYAARLNEISFVDNPALREARFTYIKADGSREEVRHDPATRSPKELIIAMKGDNTVPARKPARKGMYSINRMADILAAASSLKYSLENDGRYEHDEGDFDIAEDVQKWLASGADILKQIVDHEIGELIAVTKAAQKGDVNMNELEKAARGSLIAHLTKAADVNKQMGVFLTSISDQYTAMADAEDGAETPNKTFRAHCRTMSGQFGKMAKVLDESFTSHSTFIKAFTDATDIIEAAPATEPAPVTKAAQKTEPAAVEPQPATEPATEPATAPVEGGIQQFISTEVEKTVRNLLQESLGRVVQSDSVKKMVDEAVVDQMKANIGNRAEKTDVKTAGPQLVMRKGATNAEPAFDPEATGL